VLSRARIAAAFLLCTACSNDGAVPRSSRGGVIVVAVPGNYGSIFPPNVSTTAGRQITELMYDYLTEVGLSLDTYDDMTFAPRLARSWEWSNDSLSLAVHLHPDARWHDGEPVRSDDITYSYSIYSDTSYSSLASQLGNIDSVSVRDSLTAVFWFSRRYPLQFYDATSQMQILPRHIYGKVPVDSLNDAVSRTKPVGTGRYRFVNEVAEQSIELRADTANFRGAPHIDRIIWRRLGGADEAARALFAGEADIFDAMRASDLNQPATHPDIRVLSSPGSDYAFMAFNLERPPFASRDLRRALSMAVDREAMVKNVFGAMAIPAIGPTLTYFPTTSKTLKPLPYDTARAGRLLDSLGWRANRATGIRTQNGKELSFKAIVPTSSSNRMRMATLLQEQFRRIGVAFEPDQMEIGAFNAKFAGHEFDAALASWHLGTSPASIRILWTSNAPQNMGSYRNPQFDMYVDSAVTTVDAGKAAAFYNRAYQVAIDDAPALWLYEPKLVIGIHKRIRTTAYRPDAWWWSLSDWIIPASVQIDRDRAR
jgi:peptide/nickel transport system substrate-binding protein